MKSKIEVFPGNESGIVEITTTIGNVFKIEVGDLDPCILISIADGTQMKIQLVNNSCISVAPIYSKFEP